MVRLLNWVGGLIYRFACVWLITTHVFEELFCLIGDWFRNPFGTVAKNWSPSTVQRKGSSENKDGRLALQWHR